MSVPVVILAAGASRRLGRPKQLIHFRGETLLDRSLRIARQAGVETMFVVLGANAETILDGIELRGAVPVRNEHWESGMASSVASGVRRVIEDATEASGILLMVCDQPYLTAEHLSRLVAAFAANGAQSIVASQYADDAGIPAVFPRSQFRALLALQGDHGARSLLRKAPGQSNASGQNCPVISIPFPGGEIDVDSPADLAALG